MQIEKDVISSEEIMRKIKDEIRKRKESSPHLQIVPEKSKLDYQEEWNGKYRHIEVPIYESFTDQKIIDVKESYEINELLSFNDVDFVKNAYMAILRREPDAAGFKSYLDELRSRKKSKIDILWNLRQSKEGVLYQVPIRHLKRNYYKNRMKRILLEKIPVVSYFTRLIISIARLPKILNYINAVEISGISRYEDNNKIINLMMQKLAKETDINLMEIWKQNNKNR